MMRIFFDPMSYVYTEAEWEAFTFVPRLSLLISAMQMMCDVEASVGSLYGMYKVKIDDSQYAGICKNNPYINTPPIDHYKNQFFSHVLPELMRRFDYCLAGDCQRAGVGAPGGVEFSNNCGECTKIFSEAISYCMICGDDKDPALIYKSDETEIVNPHPFFKHVICLSEFRPLLLLNSSKIFPRVACGDREAWLKLAIEVEVAHKAKADSRWAGVNIAKMYASSNFWSDIEDSDYKGSDELYFRRIISTIAQIATGMPGSANEHRMVSQTINFNGVNYPKWNSYVFQMGLSDQDRRCSRIYYAKIPDGILLDRYDQDAH